MDESSKQAEGDLPEGVGEEGEKVEGDLTKATDEAGEKVEGGLTKATSEVGEKAENLVEGEAKAGEEGQESLDKNIPVRLLYSRYTKYNTNN